MRPNEALPQDWGLYYNNTYMQHTQHGPVLIRSEAGCLYAKVFTGGVSKWEPVSPDDLYVWFPKTGSFNTKNSACYIARRAARQMRKSLTLGDLYYATFGANHTPMNSILKSLCSDKTYTSVRDATAALVNNDYLARAISREIILTKSSLRSNTIQVIYKGKYVGDLDNRTNKVNLAVPNAAINRIVVRKLRKEGLSCYSQT